MDPPAVRPANSDTARERLGFVGAWWRRWYQTNRTVVWAFAGSRIAVVLAAFVARWIEPDAGDAATRFPPWWAPLRLLGTWDAGHYLALAKDGYTTSTGLDLDRWAFFPLWPAVIQALDLALFGAGILVVAVLAAHGLALAGAVRLRAFVARETRSPATGDRAAVYMLIFPSALVFSMPYAEALFLLLSVLYLDLLRQSRWLASAGVGVLAGLTRPGGWVLAVAAAVEGLRILWERRREGLAGFVGAAMAGLGPVVGLATYLGYARHRTGDALAPIDRQWREGWKVRPRFFLDSALDKVDQIADFGVTQDVVLGTVILLAFAVALYSFRVLPVSMAAYSVVVIGLGASTEVLIGVTRVVMLAVPFVWTLAVLGERRGFDAAWRPVSAGLMTVLAVAAFTRTWIP